MTFCALSSAKGMDIKMNRYPFITQEEIRSLLYYQGAVQNIELKASDAELEEFYQISNAYETINMLLFPGIENEKARLYSEKRKIDEKILDNIEELLNIYYWLYSAMCKYTLYTTEGKMLHTRRDDRRHTYMCMKNGINDSFLSTSLNLQSQEYFQKKDGLVLMEFLAEDMVEHVDINDVLGSKSIFQDENEILYSPFLYLTIDPLALDENEKTFQDYHKAPPYGKYLITLKGSTINPKKPTRDDKEWLIRQREKLIDAKEIENIKKVWNAIRTNAENSCQDEIEQYIVWKQSLVVYLREIYAIIKYEQKKFWENQRTEMFVRDLTKRRDYSNEKREEYESELQRYAKNETYIGVSVGFLIALILMGINCIALKVLVAFLLAGFSVVKLTCDIKSLKPKLLQRTRTYLKYDELLNDWNYENNKTEKVLETYITKMREIEKADNQSCEEYTGQMVQDVSGFEEKTGKMADQIK